MAITENPFMNYVRDFEKEAEAFLRKYQCADAIDTPRRIPIKKIATELMSLDIVDTEMLSVDGSVHGAIAFIGGTIDVYDWLSQETIGYTVKYPTIFIDAETTNIGRYNNTLAHECYHWWKHRNYFNFRRKHQNGKEFAFRCQQRSSGQGDSTGDDSSQIDIMERQAKKMAPKILMPRNAFIKKVEETYKAHLPNGSNDRQLVTNHVIDSVAEFFDVSRQSAAIRMCELGYEEAKEFCPANSFVPENEKKLGTLKISQARNHQRPITLAEAFKLYQKDEFLRSILDTGAFCFVEGYFTLKDERYVIEEESGGLALSDYAKSHLVECTLDFSARLVSDGSVYKGTQLMFRSDSAYHEQRSFDANPQNVELLSKAKDFQKKFQRAQAKAITPAAWMKQRMEEENWHQYTFEAKTGLDKMNYSRVQSGTHNFTMRPLVAMGVGLGLSAEEMQDVLHLGGMHFIEGNLEHEALKYLFSAFYGRSIDECNEFLREVGVDPLGSKQRM